jgi:parvulin-like peptidyl-prolyl isomerase
MPVIRTVGLMGLALLVWACQPGPGSEVVALINGRPITLTDLRRALAGYGLSGRPGDEVVASVLDELIDRSLILQQAEAKGLTISPEELAAAEAEFREDYPDDSFQEILLTRAMDLAEWRRELMIRLLVERTVESEVEARLEISPDEVEVEAGRNREEKGEDKVKVAQIMTFEQAEAQEALKELKAGRPFKEVAEKYSAMAGQAGQETDYFGRGEMPPELEKAVWPLKPGQISRVVKSDYGWHVFIVLDRRKADQVNRRKAVERLRQSRKAELQAAWLLDLRTKAEIKTYPARLAEISNALGEGSK